VVASLRKIVLGETRGGKEKTDAKTPLDLRRVDEEKLEGEAR